MYSRPSGSGERRARRTSRRARASAAVGGRPNTSLAAHGVLRSGSALMTRIGVFAGGTGVSTVVAVTVGMAIGDGPRRLGSRLVGRRPGRLSRRLVGLMIMVGIGTRETSVESHFLLRMRGPTKVRIDEIPRILLC
jgi:hypothetical protein